MAATNTVIEVVSETCESWNAFVMIVRIGSGGLGGCWCCSIVPPTILRDPPVPVVDELIFTLDGSRPRRPDKLPKIKIRLQISNF